MQWQPGFYLYVSNSVTEAKGKHIDIKWHSIQELVSDKIIELFFGCLAWGSVEWVP